MKRFLIAILLCSIPYAFGCKSESWSAPEKKPEQELKISLGFKEDTHCGEEKGTIILVAEGGSGHYKFHSPQFGENHSGLFNDLPAGSHLFILSDEHGNSDSLEVLIENLDGVVIESYTAENPTIEEGGSIRIRVKGGEPPYVYKLDDGLLQTGKVFNNLNPGLFRITAIDSKGCEFSRTIKLKEKTSLASI